MPKRHKILVQNRYTPRKQLYLKEMKKKKFQTEWNPFLPLKSLDIFCDQWNHQYPKIGESWRANWENIRTIFSYPAEIRHAIYTTNAIESLNSVIRHSTKKRKIFSSDDSVKKVIYLATSNAAKKWTMPIQNWRLAMNWFTIQFDDRLKDHL